MGMAPGGFHKINDMRAQCFRENGRFLTKYGHESIVFFFENGRFFTKYVHESVVFS